MTQIRDLSDLIGAIPRHRPEDIATVRRLAANQPDAAEILAALGIDQEDQK